MKTLLERIEKNRRKRERRHELRGVHVCPKCAAPDPSFSIVGLFRCASCGAEWIERNVIKPGDLGEG